MGQVFTWEAYCMRTSKFRKNIRLLKLISKTFGLKFRYIVLFIFNTLLGWTNSLFLFFDRIFFPSVRKHGKNKPVFLIGHLRSGTTFLHRFLSAHSIDLRPLYLWEMILPSLSIKKFLKPFLPGIRKISLDKIYDPNIHKTGLDKEETDDIALYFRYLDGMLSWIYFHAWQVFDSGEALRASVMEVCNQSKFVSYLKRVYDILAYQSGRRILSKSFSSLFYLEEMRRENPDGKFIILIRDPREAIPSLMSLEESVQNNMHGKKKVEENREQYFMNLYRLSIFYYETLEKTWEKYRHDSQFLFLSYDQMKNDFGATMEKLISHCELTADDDLLRAIEKQDKKQTGFKSSHAYSLERFKLREEYLIRDTPFYNRFLKEYQS